VQYISVAERPLAVIGHAVKEQFSVAAIAAKIADEAPLWRLRQSGFTSLKNPSKFIDSGFFAWDNLGILQLKDTRTVFGLLSHYVSLVSHS